MKQIPFMCLKYISDGADGTAADDWAVQVHNAAVAFKRILFPKRTNNISNNYRFHQANERLMIIITPWAASGHYWQLSASIF